jgi:hypothetical protein
VGRSKEAFKQVTFFGKPMTIMSESHEIKEIKRVFEGLQTLYNTSFPKSDPSLIHDLLRRSQKNPNIPPIFMVEVFTKPGVNPEAAKKYIFEKTGMVPAIYENGTHYVTNHKLTLEMLKEISDSEVDVRLSITRIIEGSSMASMDIL